MIKSNNLKEHPNKERGNSNNLYMRNSLRIHNFCCWWMTSISKYNKKIVSYLSWRKRIFIWRKDRM